MTAKLIKLISDAAMAAIRNSRSGVLWLGLLAIGATILGPARPAVAETLSISATGFVMRYTGSGDATDIAQENNGVFLGQMTPSKYFLPVVFPVTTGQKICKFTMVYEDVNGGEVLTAHLLRKSFTVGGNPFNAPTTIATVSSASGTPATVREVSTTSIQSPTISVTNAFYYIESQNINVNLNPIGFFIVYKPVGGSC